MDTESFIKGNISTFEHLVTCIANDDMLARFRYDFDSNDETTMPLQTRLLRNFISHITTQAAKTWRRRVDHEQAVHLPFAMLTICHTIKQKFRALSSDVEFRESFKDNTATGEKYADIGDYVTTQTNTVSNLMQIASLGAWSTPDMAYIRLYGNPVSISTYNASIDAMPSPAKRVKLTTKDTQYQVMERRVNDLANQLLDRQKRSAPPGDNTGFLVGNGRVPIFPTVAEFCHNHAKTNRSCTNPNCSRRHMAWTDFSDNQKKEISNTIGPIADLNLVQGLVVPQGSGSNPVNIDNTPPTAQSTSQSASRPSQGRGWGGRSGWTNHYRRN